MATQTSTLTVKGKLGNVVGYKGRGKQLARIRVTEIKNPNTEAQAIQRMITATNARAYSRLKVICDHSFEGVAYKQASQDFFLKENAKRIRQWVANNYPAVTETDANNYVGLSGVDDAYASGVGCLISKGSLPEIPVARDGDGSILHFGALINNETSIQGLLDALGAVPGDQITMLNLIDGTLYLSRYVTNPAATAEQLNATYSVANLAAILLEKSIISPRAMLGVNSDGVQVNDDVEGDINTGQGAAIILSRKAADGSWLRSTQTLVWASDSDTAGLEAPEFTVPQWVAGKTEIDVNNPWYLNQAKTPATSDF